MQVLGMNMLTLRSRMSHESFHSAALVMTYHTSATARSGCMHSQAIVQGICAVLHAAAQLPQTACRQPQRQSHATYVAGWRQNATHMYSLARQSDTAQTTAPKMQHNESMCRHECMLVRCSNTAPAARNRTACDEAAQAATPHTHEL